MEKEETKNARGEVIGHHWKASREEIRQHHEDEYLVGIL